MMKKGKQYLAALLTAILFCVPVSAWAEDSPCSVAVNHYTIPMEPSPVLRGGSVLVPVCPFATALWRSAEWNEENGTFQITRAKTHEYVSFAMDSDKLTVDGEEKQMAMPPQVIGGMTYVPLRDWCEAVGYEVEWDAQKRTAVFYTDDKEIINKLHEFDNWLEEDGRLLDFILSKYDPETGLFYYCGSARDYDQFGPGIESTAHCLNMLSYARPFGVYTDFYDALPQSYKDKAVKTLQSWQSEEDGYFYVPWQPKESQTSAKRERDLSNATSLLKKLGGAPLYLLPSERLQQNKAGAAKASSSANALPPQYQSEEAMLAWLNGLSWSSSPYSALHQVSASVNTIKAAGFYQLVCDYISEKQNPATGLWGEGVDHKAVDAALKAGAVYSKEYPMPHLEKIIDNVLKVLEVNEGLENACQIWNPIRVLQYGYEFYDYRLPKEIEDKFRKQLPAIIDLTIANAKKFQQDDGGLSYYMNWTPNKAQGSPNGLGLAEGNTDHTLLGTFLSRNTMTDIANQTIQTPLFTESADKILAVLSSNEPVVKKERAIGTNKDFEDLEPGGKLPWDVVSTCLIGGVTVAEDPYRENNKVLRLESLPGAESGVSIIAQSYDDSKSITLECELLFESLTKGSSAYNEIGDLNGVQWCFTSPDGVSVSLARRNNQAGVGTIMQTGLKMKKWYTLKIVYEPRETDDSQVTYYLDGRIIDRTNQYYNGDKASQLPARRIERVTFHPFQAAQGVIYIDNVKVSAER